MSRPWRRPWPTSSVAPGVGGRASVSADSARLAAPGRPRRPGPMALSGAAGISSTLTVPPAASIFARADCGERVGDDEQRRRQLAVAEDLERLVQGPDEPDGAQDVLVDRDLGGGLGLALRRASGASTSNAPRSAAAAMAPMFTTSYSILNRFLKPRSFGMRMWSGVWPPSNQGGMPPPARAFWPFVPRPAVLPLPAAMPRPTRMRSLRDPSAGRRSWSFMPSPRRRRWRDAWSARSAISSTVTRKRTWRTMPARRAGCR